MSLSTDWMKEKLSRINVCTVQYVRWLMSDVRLWHSLKFVHEWLKDNPEFDGRWSQARENMLDSLRRELLDMLRLTATDEDCKFDEEFIGNVDFDLIASWLEDDDLVLSYIRDNNLVNRLYEVA